MAGDALSAGMLALSGYQAYTEYQAGDAAKEAYDRAAAETRRQAQYEQRAAALEAKQIDREARAQESALRAAAGGKGLRVAGSVATQTNRVLTDAERRKATLSYRISEALRRSDVQATDLERRGHEARTASRINAAGSLLTGFYNVDRRRERRGMGYGELLFGKRGKSYYKSDTSQRWKTSFTEEEKRASRRVYRMH